jgi:hypothetical protein
MEIPCESLNKGVLRDNFSFSILAKVILSLSEDGFSALCLENLLESNEKEA